MNSPHVDSEMLLAMATGEVHPTRARSVLDHLDECPTCAAQYEVVVALRANREAALEVLHNVPREDAPPHRSWAARGLLFAAFTAAAGVALVWWLTQTGG